MLARSIGEVYLLNEVCRSHIFISRHIYKLGNWGFFNKLFAKTIFLGNCRVYRRAHLRNAPRGLAELIVRLQSDGGGVHAG